MAQNCASLDQFGPKQKGATGEVDKASLEAYIGKRLNAFETPKEKKIVILDISKLLLLEPHPVQNNPEEGQRLAL